MLRLMQAEIKCDFESKWIETASVAISFLIFDISISLNNVKNLSDAVVVLLIVLFALPWSLVTVVLTKMRQSEASYALHWINLYLKYGYVPDRDYDIEEEQERRKYRKGDRTEKMHPYQEPE